MTQFEIGKTYFTRSIGDADCIIKVEVVGRTEKTIKARTSRGVQSFRVKSYNGAEYVKPWGSYSMAPMVSADRVRA